MGSAATYELAKRGERVLGIERFSIAHDRGSSHGVNRVIRLAYYEQPSYVPLLLRAYELWAEFERQCGEQLLFKTGSIDVDTEDGEVFLGSLASCRVHDLEHEVLRADEVNRRFPAYRLPAGHWGLLQPDGGFLLSERSITRYAQAAEELGAEIHVGETVQDWHPTSSGAIQVRTDRGEYEAGSLVFAAGAWTAKLVPRFAELAVPERQVLGWFDAHDPAPFSPERFPVFNARFEEGRYYGFPQFGVPGFKIGLYHHLEQQVDPDAVSREITEQDEAVLRAAVARYFPGANGRLLAAKTCMFTNSPDEHFLLGTLPDHPQVSVAAGFSGHGFKFCSVVGEVLADLATRGETAHDIGMFGVDRFG